MSTQPSSSSSPSTTSSSNGTNIFNGTDNSQIQNSASDIVAPITKPSTFQTVTGQIGMYTGGIGLVSTWASGLTGVATTATTSGISALAATDGVSTLTVVRASIGAVLRIPVVADTLGAIGAGLSAISLAQGGLDIYKNGITTGKAFNMLSSAVGVAIGINMMLGPALWTNPVGWVVAGAIMAGTFAYASINDIITNGLNVKNGLIAAATMYAVLVLAGPIIAAALLAFSILWSVFHQPPSEAVAAKDMTQQVSAIWTAGPMVVVAGGTIAALMGFAPGKNAPVMSNLTVPSYYLTQAVQNHLLPKSVPLNSQTPSVIVEPASGDVVVVSPASNGQVNLTSYELSQNVQFVSSSSAPQGNYISFFIYNGKTAKVNPAAVKGLTTQIDLLKTAMSGNLTTQEALNAVNIAAASDKNGLTVAGG